MLGATSGLRGLPRIGPSLDAIQTRSFRAGENLGTSLGTRTANALNLGPAATPDIEPAAVRYEPATVPEGGLETRGYRPQPGGRTPSANYDRSVRQVVVTQSRLD